MQNDRCGFLAGPIGHRVYADLYGIEGFERCESQDDFGHMEDGVKIRNINSSQATIRK